MYHTPGLLPTQDGGRIVATIRLVSGQAAFPHRTRVYQACPFTFWAGGPTPDAT